VLVEAADRLETAGLVRAIALPEDINECKA